MGYTSLSGYRIYGKKYCYGRFGPTDIPIELYKSNSHILSVPIYTYSYLVKRFDNFPHLDINIFQLEKLDDKTIIAIARAVGINYLRNTKIDKGGRPRLIRLIKRKLTSVEAK